ncbi:MAG TPA: DNA polymerase III subunit chi [Gammaproteobacteria bacterium]
MMRIDFYILQTSQNRELAACRLCEKAWQQGLHIYIQAASESQAVQLDELLWTFRDGSFVPHCLTADAGAPETPVAIGWSDAPQRPMQLLINLAQTVPPFYTRFERIAEIVNQEANIKAAGRERFAFYRQQNHELHHHEI